MGNGCLSIFIFLLAINTLKVATNSSPKNFNFLVLANPQAFYLKKGSDGNDEDKNGKDWREINKNLVKSLPSDLSFGIINGDLSESGWKESYFAISEFYLHNKDLKNLSFYTGLGNRDYEDNVGKCKYAMWDGLNGCACESVSFIERRIYELLALDKVVNYTDLPRQMNMDDSLGSYSYSWDFEKVHFVQLQNYPTYEVQLHEEKGSFKFLKYSVISSLTWLADDLRMARHRQVTNIILNFHQYDGGFQKNAKEDDQRQFRAIMENYKPLAVFCANETGFTSYTHVNHSFYYNTPVFETGPAFDGKFHFVKYSSGVLTVEEWDGSSGTGIKIGNRAAQVLPATPICKIPGSPGVANEVYTTTFIPTSLEWNLVSISQPEKVIEVRDCGNPSVESWKKNDENQAWGFEKIKGDVNPEYSSWYHIKHKKTDLVLESNPSERMSLNQILKDLPTDPMDENLKSGIEKSHFQHWRPIKVSEKEILIVNRGLNLFLTANESKLGMTAGYKASEKAKLWQIKHFINESAIDNVRYFMAKEKDSWEKKFPEGETSDSNWQYLGSHQYASVVPCIGW